MTILYKLLALALCALAAVGGAWWLQASSFSKGRAAGVAEVRAEVEAVALQAERDNAAKHEQQIQKLMEAQHAKDKQLRVVALDNDRARSELERLRLALAQRNGGGGDVPSPAASAPSEYTNTLEDILGQCGRDLVELARKADGHAADAVSLRDAWPK